MHTSLISQFELYKLLASRYPIDLWEERKAFATEERISDKIEVWTHGGLTVVAGRL